MLLSAAWGAQFLEGVTPTSTSTTTNTSTSSFTNTSDRMEGRVNISNDYLLNLLKNDPNI